MMYKKIINKAFDFYNIDEIYKDKCFELLNKLNKNDYKSFKKICKKLYYEDFNEVKKLWNIKNINELFESNVDLFVTNVILLVGYRLHKKNMKKLKFDNEQINIQKRRVKECFENDLTVRKYDGIRVSQLLWAVYFIRGKIIEIGCLQFGYEDENKVKIHIPKNTNLNIIEVKKSIDKSRIEIEKIFKIKEFKYICNSWLISNQIYSILDNNTNISKFHDLFDVIDGEDCIKDILNFVYNIDKCDNYNLLQENTMLQKLIRKKLMNGNKFYLGLGILNNNNLL